jgi:hypothetical protein
VTLPQTLYWFESKFGGNCESCGTRFEQGDWIAYIPGDNRPSCTGCCEVAERGDPV